MDRELLKQIITINSDEILLLVEEGNNESIKQGVTKLKDIKRDDGTTFTLLAPPSAAESKQEAKSYYVTTGEVLAVGRDCFVEKYYPNGARCKEGDILFFKPGEAKVFKLEDGTIIATLVESAAGNIIAKEYRQIFI